MSQQHEQENDKKVDNKVDNNVDNKVDNKDNNSVNLLELVSICYDLAAQSGIKICEILESGNLHVHDKHNNEDYKKQPIKNVHMPKLNKSVTLIGLSSFEAKDPQTLADVVVQELIEQGIHSIYPDIVIKGEENLENISNQRAYIKHHRIQNVKISKPLPLKYSQLLSKYAPNFAHMYLDSNDLVLWIDPVDGTKCFTLAPKDEAAKQSVTCLIGIALKGRPIAAVINCPFAVDTKTYFAIVNIGVFGVYDEHILNAKYLINARKRNLNRRYIAASMIYDKKEEVIKYLGEFCKADEIFKMGGAGNKILSVVRGQCDAYVKISAGTKKWDICAPEAFILAIGGALTDKYGDLYTYDTNVSVENINGVVATWTTLNGYHTSYCQKSVNPKSVKEKD